MVGFFVEAHNPEMPHAAFRGQTPDEMSFGPAVALADDPISARATAMAARLAANRAMSCGRCDAPASDAVVGEIPP